MEIKGNSAYKNGQEKRLGRPSLGRVGLSVSSPPNPQIPNPLRAFRFHPFCKNPPLFHSKVPIFLTCFAIQNGKKERESEAGQF